MRHRGQYAGAADLNLDGLDQGFGFLGRKLVRDGPARRAADLPQPFLPIDTVHLVDDAVDVVAEIGAARSQIGVEFQDAVQPVDTA